MMPAGSKIHMIGRGAIFHHLVVQRTNETRGERKEECDKLQSSSGNQDGCKGEEREKGLFLGGERIDLLTSLTVTLQCPSAHLSPLSDPQHQPTSSASTICIHQAAKRKWQRICSWRCCHVWQQEPSLVQPKAFNEGGDARHLIKYLLGGPNEEEPLEICAHTRPLQWRETPNNLNVINNVIIASLRRQHEVLLLLSYIKSLFLTIEIANPHT